MDSPQPTGHNVLDSAIYTGAFLSLAGFFADYSRELVGLSGFLTATLAVYKWYKNIRNEINSRKITKLDNRDIE